MLYDPIQGQGHGGPKVDLLILHVIKTPMMNYGTGGQYVNFFWTDF